MPVSLFSATALTWLLNVFTVHWRFQIYLEPLTPQYEVSVHLDQ